MANKSSTDILNDVYDSVNSRLRTNSTATATPPTIIVTHGSVSAVAQSATGTIATVTATTGQKLYGFFGSGQRAGYYYIEINAVKKLDDRAGDRSDSSRMFLPGGLALSNGDSVVLKVTNEGQGTSDYNGGIILG